MCLHGGRHGRFQRGHSDLLAVLYTVPSFYRRSTAVIPGFFKRSHRVAVIKHHGMESFFDVYRTCTVGIKKKFPRSTRATGARSKKTECERELNAD